MELSYYESPIGILELVCENNELISLKKVDIIEKCNTETKFIKNIKLQLDKYFLKKRKNFEIKVNLKGTNFQKRVWEELQNIPYGETRSYSQVAIAIGNEKSQRAIGLACNKNPIMIVIPCHRVISANGELGGYAYGNPVKQKLLELEKMEMRGVEPLSDADTN